MDCEKNLATLWRNNRKCNKWKSDHELATSGHIQGSLNLSLGSSNYYSALQLRQKKKKEKRKLSARVGQSCRIGTLYYLNLNFYDFNLGKYFECDFNLTTHSVVAWSLDYKTLFPPRATQRNIELAYCTYLPF